MFCRARLCHVCVRAFVCVCVRERARESAYVCARVLQLPVPAGWGIAADLPFGCGLCGLC